ncbi:hypothetical protein [Paenibacillus sp. GCM10027626]|uniref:hypothetical protein n=1 Tax=Paenibacillus sp. GCM10027626 TaxID=3273411 RepID=UPI0036429215
MNGLKELFRGKRSDKPSNITKYPVGTRVPRNEKAEQIVRNALIQSSNFNKTKRSI